MTQLKREKNSGGRKTSTSFLSKVGWILAFIGIPFGSAIASLPLLLAGGIKEGRKGSWDDLILVIAGIFLAAFFFSLINARNKILALGSVVGLALMIYSAYLGAEILVTDKGFSRLLMKILLICAIISSLWALFGYFNGVNGRAKGIFAGENGFATMMVFSLIWVVAYSTFLSGKWKWIVEVSLFPLYLAIIFSFSRGAWLGLIAAMIIYALAERKALWIFVIMTLILVGLIIGYSPVSNRFASITNLSFSSNLLRFQIWKTTWNMIKHHPYLGIGMGNFMVVFRDYAPPDFQNRAFPFAHNIFLQILAEGGILTLLSFTAIIILTLLKGIRIIKYSQGFPQKIGLASTVALVAILIQNQFDCTLYSLHMGPLFWMLVGLICFTEKKVNLSKKIDK